MSDRVYLTAADRVALVYRSFPAREVLTVFAVSAREVERRLIHSGVQRWALPAIGAKS